MEKPAKNRRIVSRLVGPLRDFMRKQTAGSILLVLSLVVALLWANYRPESYSRFWSMPATFSLRSFSINGNLLFWLNDGLMTVFFLVVGLEIKRELLTGELASLKKAALPVFSALGGMVVPGIIYAFFNASGPGSRGWGIPMATDIAFALGALTLLGKKVPPALKVFLVALAIVDDMGAVVLIALFYTASISGFYLLAAVLAYGLLWLFNLLRIGGRILYFLTGIILWYALYRAGIHPAISGVLLASAIPARPVIRFRYFVSLSQKILGALGVLRSDVRPHRQEEEQIAQALEKKSHLAQSPLHVLEHTLNPWATFVIMPLFALANAGVILEREAISQLGSPIGLGIICGLILGKPIGITLAAWLSIQFGLAARPRASSWMQIAGVAMLGGIGFTMSIFISTLAFSDPAMLSLSKIGILTASVLAMVSGSVWLGMSVRKRRVESNKSLPQRVKPF